MPVWFPKPVGWGRAKPDEPPEPADPRPVLPRSGRGVAGLRWEAFDNYLQAAIVFGRSVYQYMQSLDDTPGADAEYRQWFTAKSAAMKADPILESFRKSRDLLVHHRHVPVQRRIFLTGSVAAHAAMYGELTVIRGEPWYRRSLGILWQDAKATTMRPVHRWRHRLREAVRRRRRALRQSVEAWRTQRRNRNVVPTFREFYLDDPEGLDRPAVDLVRVYLDRLEAVVAEAEALFPTVVG